MKKLKKILLINWLYFSKELIEVGDVNFLTGKNGAGKSTVIDALQIVLLGETNARNFNQAANEKSQRTLDGYLRADMDENNPYSRRGKDFSSYIACEFQDEVEGTSFVTGVVFDCRSDGSRQERFFIYVGTLPENCFIENGEAMEIPALRRYLKQNYAKAEIYDTQKEYRRNMLSRWNVHNEQVLRMMKKAVSFRPIVDIQKFITENICDIPDKPDIEAMQQNIRDYKRHELLAQRQEEKLAALQEIGRLYREMHQAIDRWQVLPAVFAYDFGEKEKYRTDAYYDEVCHGIDLAMLSCKPMDKTAFAELCAPLHRRGVVHILATMGAAGQMLSVQGKIVEKTTQMVEASDTMGAGDSFLAAFLCSLYTAGWQKAKPMPEQALLAALAAGQQVSARNCMAQGGFGCKAEISPDGTE